MLQILVLFLTLWRQEPVKPLPDPSQFLAEFRKTLHSDDTLLSQYTYTETEKQISLDGNGNAKKTDISIYQVLHRAGSGRSYRRLITKNGVPISQSELEKRDRDEEERAAKNQIESESLKRQQEKAKRDREEQETLDDIFAMYTMRMLGREMIDGIPTIAVTFSANPNYKPKTRGGKILQHIGGRAWIAEDDHELARLEAQVNDPISIGAGILAKLQKGSTVNFERRKINNEIWLPVKVDAALNARLLLIKGL